MLILAIINTILILAILGILIYYLVQNKDKGDCSSSDQAIDNIIKNGNIIDRKPKNYIKENLEMNDNQKTTSPKPKSAILQMRSPQTPQQTPQQIRSQQTNIRQKPIINKNLDDAGNIGSFT